MKLDLSEAEVIEELLDRISKTCGVTFKEDQSSIYIRSADWQVRLVIADIETPEILERRAAVERRMERLRSRLTGLGVDLAAELHYAEFGEYPK